MAGGRAARYELYESINYYQYEEKLDNLFARSQVK